MLPVNQIKVFLQVSRVNMAFAELQLSPRVVVDIVDTHFLHDAKTSLRRWRDLVGDGKGGEDIVQREDVGIREKRWKDYEIEGNMSEFEDGGRKETKEGNTQGYLLLRGLKVNF